MACSEMTHDWFQAPKRGAEAYLLCHPWSTDEGISLYTQPAMRQGMGALLHPFITFFISFLLCKLYTFQTFAERDNAAPM